MNRMTRSLWRAKEIHQTMLIVRQHRHVARLLPLAGAIAAVVAFGANSATAQAALAGACNTSPLSQPFAAWGDLNAYELAPGGDFQNGAPGWKLSGGAKIVTGGDPFVATSTPMSLQLPAGATAQSPYTCVNVSYPLFRFFARNEGANSNIQVSILYNNLVLGIIPLNVGTVTTTSNWAPSPQLSTAALLGTLTSLGNADVSLRFTAAGGPAQLDDLYIDPRCM
jgi:hypothetical protein